MDLKVIMIKDGLTKQYQNIQSHYLDIHLLSIGRNSSLRETFSFRINLPENSLQYVCILDFHLYSLLVRFMDTIVGVIHLIILHVKCLCDILQ